jgi:hypothetical protein
MDRSGALPDRCVVCNAEAAGYRVTRKLYWSPTPWRVGAFATPFAILGAGIVSQSPWLLVLFWPSVLLLMIAHTFVRKKVEIEVAFCPRHRRLRGALLALSWALVAGVVASMFLWRADGGLAAWLLLGSIGGMVAVMIAQASAGVQGIAVRRLDASHAWLGGTGKPFRSALPELPG